MAETELPPSDPVAEPAAASTAGRLLSLDALRGFDMFWIMGADSLGGALAGMASGPVTHALAEQLDHVAWEGFRFYDLIFPLFVFIAGVSLVFSLGKIVPRYGKDAAFTRLAKRALLLYLLGIFTYGGFSTPFDQIRLLGVLQRIAICYAVTGFLFIFFRPRTLVAVALAILLGYWALLALVPAPGQPAVSFAEGKNIVNWFDSRYLPLRKWDGDHDPEGPAVVRRSSSPDLDVLMKAGECVPERQPGACQQRLGRFGADTELRGNLVHRPSLNVFPLQRVTIRFGQRIECDLNQPGDLSPAVLFVRSAGAHRAQGFERRLHVRSVLDQGHFGHSALAEGVVRADLVPAERAQPRKEGGFASVGRELGQGLAERELNDIRGGVDVVTRPRRGKAIEPRRIVVEELVEGGFVSAEQAACQRPVRLVQLRHDASTSSSDFAWLAW